MTSNSRVEHEKQLTIGTDPRGSFVTLELEVRHEGPEKTTTGEVISRTTTDGKTAVTEWRELSICGTSRNGGGQMNDIIRKELPEYKALAIPRENIVRILDIWDEWHLNGTEAACDHQRKNWDITAKIVQTQYQIEWDAVRRLERTVASDYGRQFGGPMPAGYIKDLPQLKAASKWSGAADLLLTVKLLGLESFAWKTIDPKVYADCTRKVPGLNKTRLPSLDDGSKALSEHIKTRTESKGVNWVRPQEDSRGILCKPCEVCGYKYGSSWLIRVLPPEIVTEIVSLFTTDAPAVTAESEIDGFAKEHGISFTCESIKKRPDGFGEGEHMTRHFKCSILRDGKEMVVYFSQGSAHTVDPTLHDVLESLGSDVSGIEYGFEDWASNMGFDTDSRKAEKVFAEVQKQSEQLKGVLGEGLYKQVLEQSYAS